MEKQASRMSDYTDNSLFISPEQAISDLQKFLKEKFKILKSFKMK